MQLKFIAAGLLTFLAFNAHAIDQMYNWNGLEFVTSGNTTHVHPSSPESTRLRGGWTLDISDIEPKATASHPVPYKNSGGSALAKINVTPSLSPSKIADAASKAAGAAAGGAAAGGPYVAFGAVVCAFVCEPLVAGLVDWGLEKFKKNPDGSLSVEVPDSSAHFSESTGLEYSLGYSFFLSKHAACSAYAPVWATAQSPRTFSVSVGTALNSPCIINFVLTAPLNGNPIGYAGSSSHNFSSRPSSCSAGSSVVNNVCNGHATVERELGSYLQSNYMGKGWDHHWAKITAGLVAAGVNVFTDGTSTGITGPSVVPVSTSSSSTSVNVVPGTTTPVSSGHTGPSDPGTQTTTTTTTARNTFNPAPLKSGSAGSPASGPSMQTTQTTVTTTSITNNVTNITNIVNETTTEKDEAPEENATDTPLIGIPELYKQKYPNGISGVWTEFKSTVDSTSFFRLITSLTPNISGAGVCPSWTIDLTWTPGGSMGVHRIGEDYCWIWPILKIIVIVTTLFTCRRLIFGG